MVELGRRAGRLVVNTSRVELEGLVRSVNGNRGRLLVDGVEEGLLVSGWDIVESREGSSAVGSVVLASVRSSGGIRV